MKWMVLILTLCLVACGETQEIRVVVVQATSIPPTSTPEPTATPTPVPTPTFRPTDTPSPTPDPVPSLSAASQVYRGQMFSWLNYLVESVTTIENLMYQVRNNPRAFNDESIYTFGQYAGENIARRAQQIREYQPPAGEEPLHAQILAYANACDAVATPLTDLLDAYKGGDLSAVPALAESIDGSQKKCYEAGVPVWDQLGYLHAYAP